MNSLDSRSLHLGDCFAQTFSATDQFHYVVVAGSHSPASAPVETSKGYVINVAASTGATRQQTITLSMVNGELVPDGPNPLNIVVGDTVLWHSPAKSSRRYAIVGTGGSSSFSSGALRAGAVYTHPFGTPGTHDWIDPIGRSLSATVEVSAVSLGTEMDHQNWMKVIATPAIFEIEAGKVTPKTLQIVVGQRVFWRVKDGTGVAITDKRLVPY